VTEAIFSRFGDRVDRGLREVEVEVDAVPGEGAADPVEVKTSGTLPS
jgi:hypothetical protein